MSRNSPVFATKRGYLTKYAHACGYIDTAAVGNDSRAIQLSTGGPASRIVGELNQYGDPVNARLEVQDWGTPWTEYREDDLEDVLLDYARCFYFGEG